MVHAREIFEDPDSVAEIQEKLPKLFRMAEIESSRAGKIRMEVGSMREKILISYFIYKFGRENVDTDLPITEPEADVKVDGEEISIKTITGKGGTKAVWTVDAESARNFIQNYEPRCDIALVEINWGTTKGGVYFIPVSVQQEIFGELGRTTYLKMPKPGTNTLRVSFRTLLSNSLYSCKLKSSSYSFPTLYGGEVIIKCTESSGSSLISALDLQKILFTDFSGISFSSPSFLEYFTRISLYIFES